MGLGHTRTVIVLVRIMRSSLGLRTRFMMAQRHADAGGDGRKALNGHGQRQKHDDQKLGQADAHRVVV